ncbi:hypothetical protein BDN67DRAFT_918341 [Paxillus ammoniavirescens]|nr:hypothetical protein BDN67DRAFT_918341 [Paxillus ammoniavirescens]
MHRSERKGINTKTSKPHRPRKAKKVTRSPEAPATEEDQPEVKEGGRTRAELQVGKKREVEEVSGTQLEDEAEESPTKRLKTEEGESAKYSFHPGVIERGHIYFFYRPKVQREEVHSLDDVKNMHMLLVPRPPEFSIAGKQPVQPSPEEHEEELTLISEGADVIPAPETKDQPKKFYRLLIIGKKHLPEAEGGHAAFWASVIAVGDDLHSLERGFGEKSYETKTRGVRHEGSVRLAGRGVYAIVNKEGAVPSANVTHLGYHLSHPSSPGEVQVALGIHTASSFVVQVKNPLAKVPYAQRVGLPPGSRAKYPEAILDQVFKRGSRGRQPSGLRFVPCGCIELLDYEGAELLLIASRTGASGSDKSLGEGRGEALKEAGEMESQEPVEDVFRELAIDKDAIPAEPLEGHWI